MTHSISRQEGLGVRLPYTREILQVVSNLIVNALDAILEDGTLHLRVRKSVSVRPFPLAGVARSA
jgi:signal transduction histidine kinase